MGARASRPRWEAPETANGAGGTPNTTNFSQFVFSFFAFISLQAKGFHNFWALIAEPFLNLAAILNRPLDYRN